MVDKACIVTWLRSYVVTWLRGYLLLVFTNNKQ